MESVSAPTSCPLCGHPVLFQLLRLEAGSEIWVCCGCTNAMTWPPPVATYDDDRFFVFAEKEEKRWRSLMRPVMEFVVRHIGHLGRLLDVGCSHGLLIEEFRTAGFDAEGIEPSQAAVDRCQQRGLRVRHGYLADGVFPDSSFDVIVMSHVLEHVPAPGAPLRVAARALKPGGALCLCQTNYQSTLPRWFGAGWVGWVAREHFYHFNPRGIRTVLASAGMQEFATEILPLGYRLGHNFTKPRMLMIGNFSWLVSRLRIGFPFQGDQMYVLARLGEGRQRP